MSKFSKSSKNLFTFSFLSLSKSKIFHSKASFFFLKATSSVFILSVAKSDNANLLCTSTSFLTFSRSSFACNNSEFAVFASVISEEREGFHQLKSRAFSNNSSLSFLYSLRFPCFLSSISCHFSDFLVVHISFISHFEIFSLIVFSVSKLHFFTLNQGLQLFIISKNFQK
ncbi:MAG: hypothetical protein LBQ24_03520 [Candidatus Peribacteria bacterium]|nr:hypothetical protein [Candidatus Peribacteria bacterium]